MHRFLRKNAVLLTLAALLLAAVLPLPRALQTAAQPKESSVRLPVVMYHHVSPDRSLAGPYVLPTEVLEQDFQYLQSNGYTPVSVRALRAYVTTGAPLPERPVLLTFDDGQRSFLTRVVPLLERYGFPAVVNVVGAFTDLYTENGDTNDRYACLNADDLQTLAQHPLVEIGCHSYAMHTLGDRRGMGRKAGESDEAYRAALTADLARFNERTSVLIGGQPRILAYPFGIENELLRDLAAANGFDVTLTCREVVNTVRVGGDLRELGRFNRPYGLTSEQFFAKFHETVAPKMK